MSSTAICAAGEFRGSEAGGATVWRGIRYALPPTGELRWRAPRPAPPVVADALEFGPAAPQARNAFIPLGDGVTMDEDCLFLNVWRPADHVGDPLPVMVWIHGGAYAFGTGSQPTYDGTKLAVGQGVVIVTINYRIGALGFVELSSFARDGVEFDTNLGLRDVLLALQWVQDNIAGFGGDPARVTVAGESAGGGLVTTLLACPAARGLFSRAIAESSPVSSIYGAERAASVGQRLLDHLGIAPEDIGKVRDAPVDALVTATTAIFAEIPQVAPGTLAFAPVIDGALVPEAPVDVLRAGRGIPVPLLIGTNRDEASAFAHMHSPLMPVGDEEILRMFRGLHAERPEIPLPPVDRVVAAYRGLNDKNRGLAIARDIAFRLPTLWAVEGQSKVADTWLYRFDRTTPALRMIRLGAMHAAELPYVWGTFRPRGEDATLRFGGRRAAERVSARLQARWGAFIRGEHPDAPGAAEWTTFGPERTSLVIDRADRIVTDLDASLTAAWGDATIAFR
jgi:para-nitrobenzyl esterase